MGNDTLVGDALTFSVFNRGNVGDNTPPPTGSGGADTLSGGVGDDVLIGDAYGIFGTASGGDDRLFGGDGNDMLAGDSLADGPSAPTPLFGDNGRGGNDRLFGEAGDDTLRGGSGILDGGAGVDTATFDGTRAGYTITNGLGTNGPGGTGVIVTQIASGDTDVVSAVEFLAFADVTLAVDQLV